MAITKEDVAQAVRDWLDANNGQDVERVCAMDAHAYGYGYRTRDARDLGAMTLDEYHKRISAFFQSHPGLTATFEQLETAVDGDVGLAWGVWVEEFQVPGRPPERARVRFSQTMRRGTDGWRFLLFHRDIQPFDENGRYPATLTTA